MKERWFKVDGSQIYTLMTELDSRRDTVVCIHGLGESHLSFVEAFEKLSDFNVIAIDLPGYGNSKPSLEGGHGTEKQAERVLKIISVLNLSNIILIGHSWGGDVGTAMCLQDQGTGLIKSFINVEGAIHCENNILSREVNSKLDELDALNFEKWCSGEGFVNTFPWVLDSTAGIRYLASQRRCSSQIYGETAAEICEQEESKNENDVVRLGIEFSKLKIPTVYCWGAESLKGKRYIKVLKFLENLKNKKFKGASHWVMIDASDEFYNFVQRFIFRNN